ncbi:putative sulfate exporter family transporter [Cupriavidus basilensis]
MVVLAVALTILCGIVLARLMGFQTFFGLLTGGAVAICGASRGAGPRRGHATASLEGARDAVHDVISVSTLSTVAMVLYPMLAQLLALPAVQAGAFIGGTIHDVAQVVGAGYSISHEAGDAATLVKLMRVAMLPLRDRAGGMAVAAASARTR